MRPEREILVASPGERAEEMQHAFGAAGAEEIIAGLLDTFPGEVALVSSFGAEAAVLLHLASRVDPAIPVVLVDTLMLFEETLAYQRDLSERLGLSNVQHLRPDAADLARMDPDGTLHKRDQDACCVLRKVVPMERALRRWPVVISGRKRFQSSSRRDLDIFEADGRRLRVNPLAHWQAEDIRAHMDAHNLPRHPLVNRGFPSIGCRPCTSSVDAGEHPRSGRWRGSDKVECGIHFGADGAVRRAS